ncbi:MAG TPA: RagB/SusD family nutrient uptake outer membrane protein, partial [Cytophagales bacterium]
MKRYLLLIAGLLAGTVACNDQALDKINPNELSVPTYFKTGKDIVSAVNAVYSSLQAQHLYGREYFFLHDTRSDEMQSGGGQLETHRAQLLNGVHRADNQVLTQVWQGWYRVIHQANVVIENAPKATENVTEALKNRVIGEARFLRGWAYFELVSGWGGVPLSTSVVTTPSQSKGRASEDEVYAQVIDDLSAAIASLPPKSDYSDEEIGRASRGAAQAMLARVYLQRGQYADARPLLEAVIGSGQYRLADVPYQENFREENEFNAESVWEVSFSEAFGDFNWNNAGEGPANEITFRAQEYGPTAWRN